MSNKIQIFPRDPTWYQVLINPQSAASCHQLLVIDWREIKDDYLAILSNGNTRLPGTSQALGVSRIASHS